MKLKLITLAFLVISFSVAGQSYTGDTWAQAKAKGEGTISLAYVQTFGFVYKDGDKLMGLCVDIMDDFVKFVNEKKSVKLTAQ
ncbi:MAG: ABC transporter substrate-binding protein, partial [Cyclobacteriaceae bacterium]|nr:ABC transporter substrate-binding protein [Cyclobacteriaceae bacterium]